MMYYVKINDEFYELPAGKLYINYFKDVIKDNYITLDNLPINIKYEILKKLFDFICNTMTTLNDGSDEINEVCKKMSSVDNLQSFLYKSGKVENAIKCIENFTTELLKLHSKLKNESSMRI